MDGPPAISILLPTYNEAENIGPLITRLREALRPLHDSDGNPLTYEIIVVDAGSTDETLIRARGAGADKVFVQRKRGFAMALKEGFAAARGRYVVTMDADLTHEPTLLRTMIEHAKEAHIVIASRYVRGGSSEWPAFRRILSLILNRAYSLLLWLPVRDVSSGYRIYDRRILKGMKLTCKNFDVQEEILVKAYLRGARITEIPMHYRRRAHGKSHAQILRLVFSYAKTLAKLFHLRYFFPR